MAKNVIQSVVFKNTTSGTLYDMYVDEKKHAAATGAPAQITTKAGGKFSAHDYITGEFIYLRKNASIIQTWRGRDWDEKEPDSIFIIELEADGKDTVLHAIHTNIPDKYAADIDKGWNTHYWQQWNKYLAGEPVEPPAGM
jgi:activator of HSP90 ATPase